MVDELSIPRLVVAGIGTGAGKTTVAMGIAAALRRRGRTVQPFKVGLDTHDAAYLSHVTGRPCRNLDSWILGPTGVRTSLARGSRGADVAVIEGANGLFDGHGPDRPSEDDPFPGSTAQLARIAAAPVLLVLDVSTMRETAAVMALGARRLDPTLHIVGTILNGGNGAQHRRVVEDAIWTHAKLPVLGALPRLPAATIPEWGHGLIPVSENPSIDDATEQLATAIERHCDLDLIERLMEGAGRLPEPPVESWRTAHTEPPFRLGVAFDEAFCSYYPENLELLADVGAEIVPFSPLEERALPSPLDGVYIGGGCLEVFAERLARNRTLAEALQRARDHGIPFYIEGGGMLYAARSVRINGGAVHQMSGLLPVDVTVHEGRHLPAYRDLRLSGDCLLGDRGSRLRGHEYHATARFDPGNPDALYTMHDGDGEPLGCEGWSAGAVAASLVQVHFGQDPAIATRIVTRMREARQRSRAAVAGV